MKYAGRKNARDRGYDHLWVQECRNYRALNPLCIGCLAIGVTRKTDVVDHIVPHRGDKKLFWDRSNWQPACTWHHNSIKSELENMWGRGMIDAGALRLSSREAVRLTRQRHRPMTGPDGYPIRGT